MNGTLIRNKWGYISIQKPNKPKLIGKIITSNESKPNQKLVGKREIKPGEPSQRTDDLPVIESQLIEEVAKQL